MKTIVVASHNPVKVTAAHQGFQKMFPELLFQTKTVSVPSGVRDQPMSSEETLLGARNRALAAAEIHPEADYWVGIEGGVEWSGDELAAFAWVYIYTPLLSGKGRTGTFYLPSPVTALIKQGKELGEADDIVFNKSNSKQANGAIGILTGDIIDRARLYEHAVILALTPFKNFSLYT